MKELIVGAVAPARSAATAKKPKPGKDATIMAQPFVIDLGSVTRKEAKRLKRGTGDKMDEALRAAHAAKASGAPDAPIVVLYRKKAKKGKLRLPFPFSSPF